MTCSPKGLIRSATPEEMAQGGIRWEQISAGVFQLRGPDIRQRIKNLITHLRQFAEWLEANPRTAAAAAALLYRLRVIECFLAAAERNGASGDLYQAVYHSLLLAINDHQLTVVDNEPAIAAREASIEGARSGGRLRSEGIRIRNREMAQEFQKRWEFVRRRGRKISETALMADIGAAKPRNLKRRAAINAVRSGLADLNRD